MEALREGTAKGVRARDTNSDARWVAAPEHADLEHLGSVMESTMIDVLREKEDLQKAK